MKIRKVLVTAANPRQRTLPLQTLIDPRGEPKSALQVVLEEAAGAGIEEKILVDRGVGKLLLKAVRLAPGATLEKPPMICALIAFGSAEIAGTRLGEWDFLYAKRGAKHVPITFPAGATLLTVALQ